MTKEKGGSIQDALNELTAVADAMQKTVQAVRNAAEQQEKVTAASIILRDTARRVANELAQSAAQLEESLHRWEQVSDILRSVHDRRESEAYESLSQAKDVALSMNRSVNAASRSREDREVMDRHLQDARDAGFVLHELVNEIATRFPKQKDIADKIRENLRATEEGMQRIIHPAAPWDKN